MISSPTIGMQNPGIYQNQFVINAQEMSPMLYQGYSGAMQPPHNFMPCFAPGMVPC